MPSNKIKELRKSCRLSQAKAAEKLGISDTAFQNYEYGKRDIPGDVLYKMASLFGSTVDYILGVAPANANTHDDSKPKPFVPVPLYGAVAAGVPMEMIKAEEMKEAPACFVMSDPDAYLVRVRGNSMSRTIPDGSFALVSPRQTAINDHDMFLVTVNGDDATIKRVRRLENGVELIPDSYDPTYRSRVIDFADEAAPPVNILGKVVWWCAAF